MRLYVFSETNEHAGQINGTMPSSRERCAAPVAAPGPRDLAVKGSGYFVEVWDVHNSVAFIFIDEVYDWRFRIEWLKLLVELSDHADRQARDGSRNADVGGRGGLAEIAGRNAIGADDGLLSMQSSRSSPEMSAMGRGSFLTGGVHSRRMNTLAAIAFVWAAAFAILLLPARKAGTWIARPPYGFVGASLSILLCLVLAWNVVLVGWLALIIGGREIFPHVRDDPQNFGLYFVAVFLFVPAFAALITGYVRARMALSSR